MTELFQLITHLWATTSQTINYITIDRNGRIQGFENKPEVYYNFRNGAWDVGDDESYIEILGELHCTVALWDHMIFKRPLHSRRSDLYRQIKNYFAETTQEQQKVDLYAQLEKTDTRKSNSQLKKQQQCN